jgi:hypothetical protein
MKIFRTTSKKRVIVSSGVGGVVGLIAWLLFRLYLHGVAYESTQPDPERDAAMQTAAQALGDDTTRSPTSQTTADATQEMRHAMTQPIPPTPAPSIDSIPADDPAIAQALIKITQVAKEDPNSNDYINGEDSDTFELPVYAGRTSSSEYPVYAVSCDFQKEQCTFHNAMGNALVIPLIDAANELTPIHNADVVSAAYHCQSNICANARGQIVGTVSPEMRNYLASHQ